MFDVVFELRGLKEIELGVCRNVLSLFAILIFFYNKYVRHCLEHQPRKRRSTIVVNIYYI